MKKYFFIINSKAGIHKRGKGITEKILEILSGKLVNYEWAVTEKPGHAPELAKKAVSEGFDFVVAVGGDGTVNEVAKGLAGSDVTLGIIPTGSGNGLARHLKISQNLVKAIDTILNNKTSYIDLWKLNDQLFLSVAGNGFDAEIAHKMSLSQKRGRWKYIKLVIKRSLSFNPIDIELVANQSIIKQRVLMITFANSSQFGNNAYISPKAKTDDGLIDVVIIEPVCKILYPVVGLAILLKKIHWFKFHKLYRVKNAVLNNSSSELFHIDGDPVKINAPVKIEPFNKPLQVCIP
ncbi:MAG: diacylglycerol kinase family protein [Bacteroidota bacterium]